MTRTYALKEHNLKKNEVKEYIAIRSEDGYLYINIPKEMIEKALKEFETGEEVNVNY